MSGFLVGLWESVFQPGVSTQLVVATHISLATLLIVLVTLFYLTQSVHFAALSLIAVLLWGTITWFVNELKQINLKSNQELEGSTAIESINSSTPDVKKDGSSPTAKSTGARQPQSVRSRRL